MGEAGLQEEILVLHSIYVLLGRREGIVSVEGGIKSGIHALVVGGLPQLTDHVVGEVGTDVAEIAAGDVLVVVVAIGIVGREEAVLTEAHVQLGDGGVFVIDRQEGQILLPLAGGEEDEVLLSEDIGGGNTRSVGGKLDIGILEIGLLGVALIDGLSRVKVEDDGISLTAVAERQSHGDVDLLAGQSEGAVQGMLGDDGSVDQGEDRVAKLTLLVGGLGGHQQHLVSNPLREMTRQNGVRAGDDVADVDRHANEAEGIEDADVAFTAVMSGEGGGGDEGLLPHLGGGHLHATHDRGIKGQKLGDTDLPLVVNTDGGKVFGMLTLSRHQGRAHGKAVHLAHLGVVDRGLDTQIQIGGGIENGIVDVVGNTGGEINEGVDDLLLGGIGHVQVHSLVGVQVVVGVERLGAFIEQHQLVVIDRHAHAHLGGNGFRGGSLQVSTSEEGAQLGGVEGQGAVLATGDEIGAALLQLAVGVILLTVQGNSQGLAATQHLFDAVGGGVPRVVGELRCGKLYCGNGGIRGNDGLIGGVFRSNGIEGIGGRSALIGGIPLVAGNGGEQQRQEQQGGGEKADELISFHDSFSFLGRMGGH